MAGHAQLKFVMTECSKTQIRLTRHNYNVYDNVFQTSRFWFNAFTSRGTTESEGVTNEGANFDEPPDYDSLSPPPPASTVECPPAYNEVIKDTVKYKVNDNTPDTIVFV